PPRPRPGLRQRPPAPGARALTPDRYACERPHDVPAGVGSPHRMTCPGHHRGPTGAGAAHAMADLTLAGLSEDRTRLLLVDDAGEEFTLAVDTTLRTALRGAEPRPGQLENRMDSALRPRDIQARIRAGETPEAVAEAAGSSVD